MHAHLSGSALIRLFKEDLIALTELFTTLDAASYGAYVMDLDRRILFWNRSAERILGHRADEVMGRQCYEALLGLPEQPSVPTCTACCLAIRLAEARRMAPVARVRMRCAWGGRKRVDVLVLTVPGAPEDRPVLVHLFHEPGAALPAGRVGATARHGALGARTSMGGSGGHRRGGPLTPRELEVVRLLAIGEEIESVCDRLHLSRHTVLNHVRNAREKLNARTRLGLVLAAQRGGLV